MGYKEVIMVVDVSIEALEIIKDLSALLDDQRVTIKELKSDIYALQEALMRERGKGKTVSTIGEEYEVKSSV